MKTHELDREDALADARYRRRVAMTRCGVCGCFADNHAPGCPEAVDPEQVELDELVAEFGQAIDEVLP